MLHKNVEHVLNSHLSKLISSLTV